MIIHINAFGNAHAHKHEAEIAARMHKELGLHGRKPPGENIHSAAAKEATRLRNYKRLANLLPDRWVATTEASEWIGRINAHAPLRKMEEYGLIRMKQEVHEGRYVNFWRPSHRGSNPFSAGQGHKNT